MTFLSTVIFRGHTLSLCTMKPAQGQTSESFTSFTRGLVIKAKSVSSKLRSKFRKVAFTKHKNAIDSLPIDVKFIYDSARLGLFSPANILQIADVALRVVFLLFLPCF